MLTGVLQCTCVLVSGNRSHHSSHYSGIVWHHHPSHVGHCHLAAISGDGVCEVLSSRLKAEERRVGRNLQNWRLTFHSQPATCTWLPASPSKSGWIGSCRTLYPVLFPSASLHLLSRHHSRHPLTRPNLNELFAKTRLLEHLKPSRTTKSILIIPYPVLAYRVLITLLQR